MQPKKTFTHFFKIQKNPDVDNRRIPGLHISNNAGIIYDNFEESFYGVQSEDLIRKQAMIELFFCLFVVCFSKIKD